MSLPNGVCDEYDAVTGVDTRRIGKMIFDGTETFAQNAQGYYTLTLPRKSASIYNILCGHLVVKYSLSPSNNTFISENKATLFLGFGAFATTDEFKAYLAAQHATGTPVTVYYELAEPVITQHTPAAIPSIYPTTTVYADTGNVAVGYNRDSNKIINQLTSAIIALGGTL